ncbi:MAG: ATPase [Tissierellaceae bacterium]|jgi:DNA repair exonuclease SbcCD ATPase subunit|nr:ATPase [Tissierellia bacterium]
MNEKIIALDEKISDLRDFLAREGGKREKLEEQLKEVDADLILVSDNIELLEKVIILYQKTAEFARKQATMQIESLVTKCLQFIFESNVEFLIEIEELRDKANAEFYVVNESEDFIIKTRPELSRGGGVVDIVSLALRIAFLQIHKPKVEGPLILDEPAKHVSEEYIFNVGNFLKQTSEMFNRQIIMVTHNQHLSAISNNCYRVEIDDSVSYVTKVDH